MKWEVVDPAYLFLPQNPEDMAALDQWKECRNEAIKLSEAEISFLSQKAQIQYIQQSDRNTKFFYAIARRNSSRGQISSVNNAPEEVTAEFIRFYQQLLGTVQQVDQIDSLMAQ
ncbi:hypothetical protein Dimus_024090, partial [Dionaea muscipula]